jgi:hypothetical protein
MTLGYYNLSTDYPGSDGAMPMLYAIRDGIPFAFSGLLLIIFIVLFAGNYFLIKSRTGRAKILIALISSSFLMLILSMFLALSALVSYATVVLYAFIAIVAFILFLVSDDY